MFFFNFYQHQSSLATTVDKERCVYEIKIPWSLRESNQGPLDE